MGEGHDLTGFRSVGAGKGAAAEDDLVVDAEFAAVVPGDRGRSFVEDELDALVGGAFSVGVPVGLAMFAAAG